MLFNVEKSTPLPNALLKKGAISYRFIPFLM